MPSHQLTFCLSTLLFGMIQFTAQSHAATPTQAATEESCTALVNEEKYEESRKCFDEFFKNLPEFIVDPSEDLLSKALELRMNPDPKKQAQALKYYLQAAQTNNPYAQVEMGMLYLQGELVPLDFEQAYYWFNKAAQQNDARGQLFLGRLYQSDQFSQKDGQQAIYWLTQSANQDDRIAAEFLGDTYRDAILVPKDLSKALHWYKKAANLGNYTAILQVALFYANGYGTEKNPAKAEELLEELIPYPPTPESLTEIAQYYEQGTEGFPKDPITAKHWYKKAAKLAKQTNQIKRQ